MQVEFHPFLRGITIFCAFCASIMAKGSSTISPVNRSDIQLSLDQQMLSFFDALYNPLALVAGEKF